MDLTTWLLQMDIVLMDFIKAFDKVQHRRLWTKFNHYGIRGPLLSWIETFLTQRTWIVVDGGATDYAYRYVASGVAQGHPLDHYYSWCSQSPVDICLFAHDAVLYIHIRDRTDYSIMQNDSDNHAIWANKWQMTFHPQRYKVYFTRSRKPIKASTH